MKSSGLKVIRNDDYDKFLDLKSGNGKKQKDLIKFGLFIALFLYPSSAQVLFPHTFQPP